MEAFSIDLRQRIWEALNQREESGETIDEIAERFQVSRQWIFKLRQRFADEQTLHPKPHGGGQPRKVTDEIEQCLCDRIAEQPEATLQELRDHCGIKGSITAVWRALKRLGISRKKNGPRQGARIPRSPDPTPRVAEPTTYFGSETPVFPGRNECQYAHA